MLSHNYHSSTPAATPTWAPLPIHRWLQRCCIPWPWHFLVDPHCLFGTSSNLLPVVLRILLPKRQTLPPLDAIPDSSINFSFPLGFLHWCNSTSKATSLILLPQNHLRTQHLLAVALQRWLRHYCCDKHSLIKSSDAKSRWQNPRRASWENSGKGLEQRCWRCFVFFFALTVTE